MKHEIESVSSHFQTLRRELKIRRAADFDKLRGILICQIRELVFHHGGGFRPRNG